MLKKATPFLICAITTLASAQFDFASWQNPAEDKGLIYQKTYGIGNYVRHAKHIDPDEINSIFEVGSRDALDALRLGYHYKCPVYAFECNPEALEICRFNVKNYPYVTVIPLACWNETKELEFHPVIQSHGGALPVNIGGSSLLLTRPDGVDSHHKQGAPIKVHAVRLDEWMDKNNIAQVDLICMDTQGTTLQVLKGLGSRIKTVKYIIAECYVQPAFFGEALYPEIAAWLETEGFEAATEPHPPFCDIVFVNTAFQKGTN